MQRLLDNKQKGYIGEYLKNNIESNSRVSIASAYFTIYAFNELKNELSKIDGLRFLFNEPTFIKSEKLREEKEFVLQQKEREKALSDFVLEIKLKNNLNQTKIAYELERQGAETSTGLNKWHAAYITRVLRNPFYCGTVVYRKQYVPDYLEQKHKTNKGEVEKVIVEGKHEPIISKEDFKKVQDIMDSHTKLISLDQRKGVHSAKNIWSKKLLCECGSHFNRRVNRKNKNNTTYSYGCYNRMKHPKGYVYNDDYIKCEIKEVQEWKLELMAETIFRSITRDSNSRNAITKSLMEGVKIDENLEEKMKERIKYLNNLVEKEGTKLDKLLDMYFEKQVNMSEYERYQKKTTKKIEKYKIEIEDLERKIESLEAPEIRLEKAKQSLKKLLDFYYNGVNEKIIEEVVEKVIVHKDYFEWKLKFMNDTIKLRIIGRTVADSYVADYEND